MPPPPPLLYVECYFVVFTVIIDAGTLKSLRAEIPADGAYAAF